MDAIITINEQGLIVSSNLASEELFDYSAEQLLGHDFRMLMADPYRKEHTHSLSRYLDTVDGPSTGMKRDVVGRRQDGTTFPMHLAISEIHIDERRLFVGVVRDLSEIQERQARLQAIMDNAVDAIITIDEHGTIDSWNPATVRMFGYADNELTGQNVSMLMPQPYRDEHDGYIRKYCETGFRKIIGIGREVLGKRKDDSTFPMHLAVSEFTIGDRRLFCGIVRDISDVKEIEKQLEVMNERLEDRVQRRTLELRETQAELVRSEKFSTLGKVAGGIAHEIRNPLNAVKTSAYYLLNANNASSEKVNEHLERIDRQVNMIDNVVTALSDVAKLPDADLKPVYLVKEIRAGARSVGLPSTIDLVIELSDDLPRVLADEGQVLIAIKNLIRNARDAMPGGGLLTVAAIVTADHVCFTVTDTGTGISPENLDRIWEPLFTTRARGMGLGLSITRAIVEKNRGRLHVDSQPGEGSCFGIHLRRE